MFFVLILISFCLQFIMENPPVRILFHSEDLALEDMKRLFRRVGRDLFSVNNVNDDLRDIAEEASFGHFMTFLEDVAGKFSLLFPYKPALIILLFKNRWIGSSHPDHTSENSRVLHWLLVFARDGQSPNSNCPLRAKSPPQQRFHRCRGPPSATRCIHLRMGSDSASYSFSPTNA